MSDVNTVHTDFPSLLAPIVKDLGVRGAARALGTDTGQIYRILGGVEPKHGLGERIIEKSAQS